jgi:hypothetical protein
MVCVICSFTSNKKTNPFEGKQAAEKLAHNRSCWLLESKGMDEDEANCKGMRPVYYLL